MSKTIQIRIKDKRGGRFIIDDVVLNGYGEALGPYGIAVYITLCRHANMQSQQCWPSQQTIAKKTGMSVRQVKNMVDRCENLGLITREIAEGKYTIYTLLEPENKHLDKALHSMHPCTTDPSPLHSVQDTPAPGADKGTKEGTKEGTNILMSCKEIYKHFCERFNKNPNTYRLSEARKRKLKKRLTEFTAEEIKTAITNASNDDFYSGGGNRGWSADLDYITRNYENVEKLLNLIPRKGGKRGQYQSSNQPKKGKYDDVVER